ncbi:MAG TPA: glycosyltransferase [Acidimicrobiales bacterium]|nr:glycosyltransferase [Acidimicrobiales bacterium]
MVVHRRRPAACVRTVAALREQGVGTVVVVDNASPAEDRKAILDAHPDVVLLENGENLGFGPAANVGFRWWLTHDPTFWDRSGTAARTERSQNAGGREWVLLCPHDADPAPGCIPALVDAVAGRDDAGLACAEYGDHEWSGRPHIDHYFGSVLVPSARVPGWESCHHPHGTMMLARRACLEDIGLFDERYFAYGEEADLGMRARAAGWDVGIVWGAVVHNPGMSSETGVPEYLMLRNSLLLVRTYWGGYHAFIRFLMALATTARGVLGGRRTPFWHLSARLCALRDFLRGRTGPPPRTFALRRP